MKFGVKKARYIHPEQTVICRTDGEDMHGKNYMVVNADKPYAMEVYTILRKHGHIIPFMEERIFEIERHWEEPSNEHKNNEEKMNTELKAWLKDFNNNKIVESIEMGGIGKGYEEAIQFFAVEMIKNLVDIEPIQDLDNRVKVIEELSMKVANELKGGYSGAQVALATNIAVVFWLKTPEVGLQMMREDKPHRIIKIQKSENGVTWLDEPVNE